MTEKRSVHIPYTEPVQEYHRVIANLAAEYAPENGRILDFGCGLGFILKLVHDQSQHTRLYAADIDETCLKMTAERVPDVYTIQLTGSSDFEMVGKNYDVCVMSHVLEHMESPKAAMLAAMKLVNPGGYMVVAVPNPVRPHIFIQSVRRRHYVNQGHVCAWDRSHWMNFLENICSLNVVRYAEDSCPAFPRRLARLRVVKRMERWLSRIFPWLSFSNIAVIKKDI